MASSISLLPFIFCYFNVLGLMDTKVYQRMGLVTGVSSPMPEMKLFVVKNRIAYDKCQGFAFYYCTV